MLTQWGTVKQQEGECYMMMVQMMDIDGGYVALKWSAEDRHTEDIKVADPAKLLLSPNGKNLFQKFLDLDHDPVHHQNWMVCSYWDIPPHKKFHETSSTTSWVISKIRRTVKIPVKIPASASWSRSPPKSNHPLPVTHPNLNNFIKIRRQLFETSCWHTDKQTMWTCNLRQLGQT